MSLPDFIVCLPLERPIDELLEVGDALLASPVPAVALRAGAGATEDAIREFRARFGNNLCVGAWGVRTLAEAAQARSAGAQFLLTSRQDDRIAGFCAAHALACGAPQEPSIHAAPCDSPRTVPLQACTGHALQLAAAIRTKREARDLATALVMAPPLVDIHARPGPFIRAIRAARSTWERATTPG